MASSDAIKLSDPVVEEDDPSFALYTACESGDYAAAKAALKAGADPEFVGRTGGRPLAIAAFEGNRELCQLLMKFGAEPSEIVIESAVQRGHISLAEFLRNQVATAAQFKQARASQNRRLHEAMVAERKAKKNDLDQEHERRERGARLAHQMEKVIDHQVCAQLPREASTLTPRSCVACHFRVCARAARRRRRPRGRSIQARD